MAGLLGWARPLPLAAGRLLVELLSSTCRGRFAYM